MHCCLGLLILWSFLFPAQWLQFYSPQTLFPISAVPAHLLAHSLTPLLQPSIHLLIAVLLKTFAAACCARCSVECHFIPARRTFRPNRIKGALLWPLHVIFNETTNTYQYVHKSSVFIIIPCWSLIQVMNVIRTIHLQKIDPSWRRSNVHVL